MSAINLFLPPLRLMLEDWDATVPQRYPDTILTQGVQTIVQTGQLNNSIYSLPVGYTLTPDRTGIQPDIADPNLFALAIDCTALLFLRPQRSRYGYRTRAISETFGDIHRYVEALEAEVHRLNNGEALFQGYQSYFSWLSGISGLPVGEILAQFDVESPLWKATFTRDGMRVA